MKDEKPAKNEEPGIPPKVIRTPIPLGPGRLAHVELPADWKPKELKKLLKMLELALGDDEEVSA